ncbi:hypothetical protein TNCV_4376091 [Trichonephila clavipes]|nr:hypothetical protein TNCV_4376091 [Trichonephila clavipes]
MPVVSCSFEHHAGDNTICLGSTPIFRENIRRWSEAVQLSYPSTNFTRELAVRSLFRVPPCRKGTIHLQTSMLFRDLNPGRTTQQSVSLTTASGGQQNICA